MQRSHEALRRTMRQALAEPGHEPAPPAGSPAAGSGGPLPARQPALRRTKPPNTRGWQLRLRAGWAILPQD
eukprot:6650147-Alexandrium_andersonii.AAC.1